MTILEDLEHGLAILRRDGWTQARYIDVLGRRCATGALHHYQRVEWDDGQIIWEGGPSSIKSYGCAVDLLSRIAEEQYPDRRSEEKKVIAIVAVNDHPDTVFEDIERLYEKAIAEVS